MDGKGFCRSRFGQWFGLRGRGWFVLGRLFGIAEQIPGVHVAPGLRVPDALRPVLGRCVLGARPLISFHRSPSCLSMDLRSRRVGATG